MRKAEFKISDKEIIEIYQRTKSLRQTALAAQGLTSTSTIAKKLRTLGIEVKNYKLKPIKISDEELISLYSSGKSLMEIAQIACGSKGAMGVRKRLRELGIDTSYKTNIGKYKEKMSKSFHKYSLDEHVFDNINTEEKSYWLGFLMADGYNHVSKTAVCLRLQKEDLEILEKFRKFLGSNAPIYSFKKFTRVNHIEREYCEVRINSVHLSKQLEQLGCTQGKTYTLEFPNYISDSLINHFLRGYFDGDGCISIGDRKNRKSSDSKCYQFTIAGRREFILEAQRHIAINTGVKILPLKIQPNNFAQVMHYGGFNVVLKILNYLYRNATIYLQRKYAKYKIMVTRQSNLQK